MATATDAAPELQADGSPPATRKRTRRACDRCSSLRARCDGKQPCRRCEEYRQCCHYARVIGKRGRKPGSRRAGIESLSETRYESSEPEHQAGRLPGLHLSEQLDEQLDEQPSDRPSDRPSDQPRPHAFNSLDNVPGSRAGNDSVLPFPPLSASSSNENQSPSSLGGHYDLETQDSSRRASLDFVTRAGVQHSPDFPFPLSGHRQSHEPQPQVRQIQPEDTIPCVFKCLEPILPALEGIADTVLASELLKLYFVQPGGSLFRPASPYILTHVLRKESVLRAEHYRQTSPALLVTMLWGAAQEAEGPLFFMPGQKARVCEGLRQVMLSLISERDCDSWHRNTAGLLVKETQFTQTTTSTSAAMDDLPYSYHRRAPSVDDVLAFIIITIVVSSGAFKTDCFRWWHKALRLSRLLGLNREDDDGDDSSAMAACTKDTSCRCYACDADRLSISVAELREERRRVFWLLFCLDRHLGLSFNTPLNILDDECQIYCPLPDDMWQSNTMHSFEVDMAVSGACANRTYGPPTIVTGIHFFEYFLPLMTILGDVIQLHRYKRHPRFGGSSSSVDDHHASMTTMLEDIMARCAQSISDLSFQYQLDTSDSSSSQETQPAIRMGQLLNGVPTVTASSASIGIKIGHDSVQRAQAKLVTAYSSFILHVLHVLLYGKWDAISMLENKDGWISSVEFVKCASHSIAASDAVSRILVCDPELAFMPYLFGIYLLHGSFILLLFADRMPQIGLNESVERACEVIIRAHEICVVTLQTEFQKQFRKVLRSTLYSVRSAGGSTIEESMARRKALSLYRWSDGFTGLAL